MFGHHHPEFPYDYSPDFHGLQDASSSSAATQPLFLPPLAIPEHDCVSALRSEMTGYTSSGCSSYGGSPTSITSYGGGYIPTVIPRSHSVHKNMEIYSPMNSSPPGYLDCETSSVRKVLSAGDLQVRRFVTCSMRAYFEPY